ENSPRQGGPPERTVTFTAEARSTRWLASSASNRLRTTCEDGIDDSTDRRTVHEAAAAAAALPDVDRPLRFAGALPRREVGHCRPVEGWTALISRARYGHGDPCAVAQSRAAPAGERRRLRGAGGRALCADASRGVSVWRTGLDATNGDAVQRRRHSGFLEGARVLRAHRRAGVSQDLARCECLYADGAESGAGRGLRRGDGRHGADERGGDRRGVRLLGVRYGGR